LGFWGGLFWAGSLVLIPSASRDNSGSIRQSEQTAIFGKVGMPGAAGKDIPELLAARQLHVIDVCDTDPDGNRSKAFGRVFLTEGKSLTFYAFDLDADKVATVEVWFQSVGSAANRKELGAQSGLPARGCQGTGALGVESREP
jgi:hypothetical protein